MNSALGSPSLCCPTILVVVSALFVLGAPAQGRAEIVQPTAQASTDLSDDLRYLEIVASLEEAAKLANPSSASVAQGRAKLKSFSQLSTPAQSFILKAYDAGKASVDPVDPKAALKRFQLGANLIGLMQDVEALEVYLQSDDFQEGKVFVSAWDDIEFLTTRYPSIDRIVTPAIQARFRALDEAVSERLEQKLQAATEAGVVLDELNAKLDALLQGIEAAGQ